MFLKIAALLVSAAAIAGILLGLGAIPPGKMAVSAGFLFKLFVVFGAICFILEAFPEKPPRRPLH